MSEVRYMTLLKSFVLVEGEEGNSLLLPATGHCLDDSMENLKEIEGTCDKDGRRNATFSCFVQTHTRLAYRIAFSLLRNKQDAEDAVQEMFLKLYRGNAWKDLRDEKAFVARAVWRVALDRLPNRKEQSLDGNHIDYADDSDSPEENVIQNSQAAQLRRMIRALPGDLREVLTLSAIEDLKSREVGFLLGIPEGTVRTRLKRARAELQRRFEATGRKRQ